MSAEEIKNELSALEADQEKSIEEILAEYGVTKATEDKENKENEH
jgi:hypothetical protein